MYLYKISLDQDYSLLNGHPLVSTSLSFIIYEFLVFTRLGFNPRLSQTKDSKNDTWYLHAYHSAL